MASSRVDELKKRYEENPRRFFAPLANEYRKAGDLDAAIDLCRMHLEEQPGHLSGHIVYGQALFESSRAAEAKAVFEAALQLDPENLIALRHLGDIARGGSDAVTARHWYQRVLEADPRNEEVTALIASLEAAAVPTVVIEPPHEPPPPPNYAQQDVAPPHAAAPPSVDASAPTPVLPMPSVPAAPRLSIGLMDLDLNLADSTAPAVDLLGAVGVPDAPPPAEAAAPEVHEPPPTIDTGFSVAAEGESASALDGGALGGVAESLLVASHAGDIEVTDTSFDAPPLDQPPTFAGAAEPAAFGDSLDVTTSASEPDETAPRLSLLDSLPLVDSGEPASIGESIAAPSSNPPSAAAPPTDFDALFGDAPIADAVIGGGETTAPTEAAGFVADSFVGREPTDALLDDAPSIETPPSPFVTETMAELYLQQGFREEALGVYRQLLAQNPEDAGLAERVKHLEHGTRSSLAIDAVSEQIEAEVAAEEVRRSGSIPNVPATPVEAEAPEAASAEEASSAAQVEDIVPAAPMVEAAANALVGPTAREVFARIAARRAGPSGAVEPVAGSLMAVPEPEGVTTLAGPSAEPTSAEHAATTSISPTPTLETQGEPAATVLTPGGRLDQLFGMAGVMAEDEGSALALAAAYGGAPAAPIRGEPARRVTDELSLDSVFKDETPPRAAGVQRQSTRLRFDQFFSGGEGGESPAAPPPAPPSPAAPADDIAQFTDWLKGLKGS